MRAGVLELDPAKTVIEFTLSGSLHTVRGTFKLKHGTIEADEATGVAKGEVVVDASSGESGDSLRDNQMRDSILEAGAYPEIRFSPTHIDGHLAPDGGFEASMHGVFSIHGSQHEITVDVHGRMAGDDATAACHFSVPYVEWGLKDPSILFLRVAKEVGIDVTATGHVTWLATDSP